MEEKIMKKILFFAVACLTACHQENNLTTEHLDITLENEKAETQITVDYPQSINNGNLDALRQQVVTFVLPNYSESFENGADIFKQFAEEKNKMLSADNDFGTAMKFAYNGNILLVAQNEKFATFTLDAYIYTGGAHGMPIWSSKTLRKTDGMILNDKLLNEKVNSVAFKKLLEQGVKTYFTVQKGAFYQCDFQSDKSQSEIFENYKIDDLPLPQEKPFLTKNGVGFVYMPYEISWYANGRIAFVLPYSQMTDYMSEDALNLVKNVNKNGKIEAYVDEQTRQKYQDYLAQPEHKICQ